MSAQARGGDVGDFPLAEQLAEADEIPTLEIVLHFLAMSVLVHAALSCSSGVARRARPRSRAGKSKPPRHSTL